MNKRRTFLLTTWLLTLPLAALGAALGWWNALRHDPSGWSLLPNALEGAIYAYGFGLGVVAWLRYPGRRTPGVFNRLFYPTLAAFFAVIFFSEPLHLDVLPWLPYVLLLFIPLWALDLALRTLRPFR